MHILSFDFGTKKIGIAVGNTETKTASPLKVVFNKKNKTNWDEIKNTIDEWKPRILIIGKPLNMDGTESDIMANVENFRKRLMRLSNLSCEYVDERLTTFEAKEILQNSEIKKVDSYAAKILIDNWFNK
tara:strand:+ start:5960 stop:6346 length:387 start_codon:yes stop_codon:yes gene_type:complete